MKSRLLAGAAMLCALGLSAPVYAQSAGFTVLPNGCGTGNLQGSATRPATQNQTGQVCTTGGGSGGSSAPYVFTSTGFQQVASFATSTGFTPPATSTVCFIQAEGNPVRFRTDGVAPTATVGQLLAVGALLQETASLSTIRFIPTTGSSTLDVDCYH